MQPRLLLVVLASVFAGLATLLVIAAAATGTPFVLLAAIPLALTGGLMWYQGTGRLAARVMDGDGGPRTTVGGAGQAGRRAAREAWADEQGGVADGWAARQAARERREAAGGRGGDARDAGRGDRRRRERGGPAGDPFSDAFQQAARDRARRNARRRERRREAADARRKGAGGRDSRAAGAGPDPGGWRDVAGRNRRRRRRGGADRPPTAAEDFRTLGLEPGASDEAVKEAYREKVKELHPDTDDGDADAFKEVNDAYERLTE